MHAITYRGDEPNKVWHVVLDENTHVIREEAIAVSDGPSIHDCAITENYVLIFDLPVTFSMKMLLAGYRSEEHTSELQSLMRISYAVFCLKKKTIRQTKTTNSTNDIKL